MRAPSGIGRALDGKPATSFPFAVPLDGTFPVRAGTRSTDLGNVVAVGAAVAGTSSKGFFTADADGAGTSEVTGVRTGVSPLLLALSVADCAALLVGALAAALLPLGSEALGLLELPLTDGDWL